jgi:ribulose-5-phosphate 4-epimerase/fuculose-1-phosphate aldolase
VTIILHFQSPFATTVACSGKDYKNSNVITEISYYIGAVAVIPYLNPGSNELAHEVVSAMK